MCAVFLDTSRAWIFDGYGPGEPWSLYDGTEAAANLEQAGFATTLFDDPNQGESNWRAAISRGVDAGLVLVNSSGMRNWFDLRPGRCRSGERGAAPSAGGRPLRALVERAVAGQHENDRRTMARERGVRVRRVGAGAVPAGVRPDAGVRETADDRRDVGNRLAVHRQRAVARRGVRRPAADLRAGVDAFGGIAPSRGRRAAAAIDAGARCGSAVSRRRRAS